MSHIACYIACDMCCMLHTMLRNLVPVASGYILYACCILYIRRIRMLSLLPCCVACYISRGSWCVLLQLFGGSARMLLGLMQLAAWLHIACCMPSASRRMLHIFAAAAVPLGPFRQPQQHVSHAASTAAATTSVQTSTRRPALIRAATRALYAAACDMAHTHPHTHTHSYLPVLVWRIQRRWPVPKADGHMCMRVTDNTPCSMKFTRYSGHRASCSMQHPHA